MSQKPRYIILIIRISYDLAVVLVWIICSPCQNIGRGLTSCTRYARTRSHQLSCLHVASHVKRNENTAIAAKTELIRIP
jgi:hypothetical protein